MYFAQGSRRSLAVTALVVLALVTGSLAACAAGRDGLEESTDSSGAVAPAPAPAVPGQTDRDSYGGSDGYATDTADPASPAMPSEESKTTGGVPADADKRLVVQTKSMLVRVKDVERAVETVRSLAAAHGGSIESLLVADDSTGPVYSQSADSQGRPLSGYVTVRVPVARYDAFVQQAAGLGKVLRQSEGSTDVTRQHVDLQARLKNLLAEEERLRELFDRAGRISDMLDVERELSRVRGEAEALQAQIDVLERQAALATITLEIVEPEPIVSPEGVDWGVAEALTEGLRQFVATLNGMIVAALAMAPVVIVIGLAALLALVVVRRRRRRAFPATSTDAGSAESDGGEA